MNSAEYSVGIYPPFDFHFGKFQITLDHSVAQESNKFYAFYEHPQEVFDILKETYPNAVQQSPTLYTVDIGGENYSLEYSAEEQVFTIKIVDPVSA